MKKISSSVWCGVTSILKNQNHTERSGKSEGDIISLGGFRGREREREGIKNLDSQKFDFSHSGLVCAEWDK